MNIYGLDEVFLSHSNNFKRFRKFQFYDTVKAGRKQARMLFVILKKKVMIVILIDHAFKDPQQINTG